MGADAKVRDSAAVEAIVVFMVDIQPWRAPHDNAMKKKCGNSFPVDSMIPSGIKSAPALRGIPLQAPKALKIFIINKRELPLRQRYPFHAGIVA